MSDDNNTSILEAIARLEVQLSTALTGLQEIRSNMVTKDVYLAKQQADEFRFQTIEQKQSEWRAESIGEHVKLEAASASRHEKAQSDSKTRHQETSSEIRTLRDRLDSADETLKQTRNGRIQAFIVAGLSLAVSVGVTLFNIALGR